MPKTPDGIAIRHLIAGVHAAELRERTAVDDFIARRVIREVVEVLQHIDSEHQFQVVGLIAALSFVIVRLHDTNPLRPWNQFLHDSQKLFLLRDACPSSSLIRLIVNCFFTSLLYLFPDIFAVLSLCGIAQSECSLMRWRKESGAQTTRLMRTGRSVEAGASLRPAFASRYNVWWREIGKIKR